MSISRSLFFFIFLSAPLLCTVFYWQTAAAGQEQILLELFPKAKEFKLPFNRRGPIKIVFRSSTDGGQWALNFEDTVINSKLKFEHEPIPSNRTVSFLKRTRFTLDKALNLYVSLVSKEKLARTESPPTVTKTSIYQYATKFEYEKGLFIVERIRNSSDSNPRWMITNNLNPERDESALNRKLNWISPEHSFDEYIAETRFDTLNDAVSIAKSNFEKARADGTLDQTCNTHLHRLNLEGK